ncbi:Accessory gene regulator B [Ruminiclostridium papyrosolvens DSM 2782]|uniref:Accessory gene regulator B n=1 Tax=Ruminiclostridium papyrosolvens DSM 2782 TaxID=588581 RepID=F1TE92_9FIRM|nr:accessory gene regulator B family protein [Ruminiclostridium papyrosolvens]EGD47058.1 Accessory gene regulator B [Ruminiclostridium papyrosolvens DSM 2782]WES35999.1 accessory gene regulator B family protein [Ruminiclostridium papyrosolvens DSM 2782]WES36097.1 accessory gene regulator B family protein [Ruminiclostridium papyrosolvens DSM 2782]
MRIIEKLSYKSANYFAKQLGLNHQQRTIRYFGFQSLYGDVVKILIMAIVSLIIKSFLATMLVAFSFAILRRNAGGFHMKTEIGCIIFTTLICVIPGTIISYFQLLSNILTIIILIIIFIFCHICLFKYAPKGSKNNMITDKDEILKFKKKSITTHRFLYIWVILFLVLNKNYISISISIGCMLEVLTILPIIQNTNRMKKTIKLY